MDKMLAFNLRHKIILPKDTKPVLSGYKDPLTPVSNGYGFLGTVAYNTDKTHVQCHKCGYFFKSLGHHASKTHNMKPADYKRRYGLMQKTSLCSPVTKAAMNGDNTKRLQELMATPEARAKQRAILDEIRPRMAHGQKRSLEEMNILGRCPDQLLAKISVMVEALGRTPTRREFARVYGEGGDLQAIYNTFGTWNEAVSMIGAVPNKRGRHRLEVYSGS